MSKRALITGATDGIGKAVATELARQGYEIDVLGRNPARGSLTLEELQNIAPKANHRLFLVDLSSINACEAFLKSYLDETTALDLLILNANTYQDKLSVSGDGVELNFAVGCVSRYLFIKYLDPLLQKSENARVVHIGGISSAPDIRYNKLSQPDYSMIHSIWQASAGSALLALHFSNSAGSTVAHQFINPGVVNTKTVSDRSFLIRNLSRLFGMIQPDECGRRITRHLTYSADISTDSFYKLDKPAKLPRALVNSEAKFQQLAQYCEQLIKTANSPGKSG